MKHMQHTMSGQQNGKPPNYLDVHYCFVAEFHLVTAVPL